jgi:hypothetical protein
MNKIDLCKTIQLNVSKLTDSENLELFKIILDTNANYTKNNNGVFLNLNWIDEELLVKINNYISFCIKSQNEISKYELMKTLLNDSINTKDTKSSAYSGDSGNVSSIVDSRTYSENAKGTVNTASDTNAAAAKATAGTAAATESVTIATEAIVASAEEATAATTAAATAATAAADSSTQSVSNTSTIPKQKFSSSMKFYLLKKKFMKQNATYNTCIDNDLTYEDYLIT